MSKFAWILLIQFSFAALIPKADFTQLSLISNLYVHFEDFHSSSEEQSGLALFFNFLAEHYGDRQHEHPGEDHHDQLPFKTINAGTQFIPHQSPQIPLSWIICDQTHRDRYRVHVSENFSNSIFHPPAIS